jgi:tetratricopeptide (TPR) repeat protein
MYRIAPLSVLLILATGLSAAPASAASADMEWAEENWKAGRYADAAKRLENVLAGGDQEEKPAARRFLAKVYMLTGKYDEVSKLFAKVEKPTPLELVLAGRAQAARGRYEEAEKTFEKAFEASKTKSVAARVELIDIWETTGRRDEAELSRSWFFKNYKKISKIRYGRVKNKQGDTDEVKDPEELMLLARAMAKRDPQGAINAMTGAQKNGKGAVEPYVRSFFLFMDKYAWSYAQKELATAYRMNKKHPEVQLATAYYQWARRKNAEAAEKALKEALKVNPNMIRARVMMANLHLFDDEYKKAKAELDKCLEVNPKDLEALSTLAAYYYDTRDQKKFDETCKKVLKINSNYSDLYNTIAGACERKRQFPQAHKFYKKAIELDPEHWRGYYGAGMALVRRGEDGAGKKLLDEAFKKNKFNLFCRNMLVVLDKLVPPKGYEPQFRGVKTEHFLIFAPRKDAPFLLPYYARCLEEAYERFHKKYKFVPENPTVVEIFSDHGHFSARTTGLPLIGADGACFGKLVTLDSARVWQNGTIPKFNWATVAEHELMHVFSLQITNYRIPRWFTEGLSVYEERVPRIELDRLFASAVRTNRLIKVKNLNRQMTRPTARMNPLLAYYQARRIVEYIYEENGMPGMERLLAECRNGVKIEKAISNALKCSMDDFEKKVLDHQKKFAAEKVRIAGAVDRATFTKLKLEAQENPNDAEKLAALAYAYLQGRRPNWAAGLKYARLAVTKGDKGPGVARGYLVLGYAAFTKDKKYRKARALFEKALAADPDSAGANLYVGVCLGKEGKSDEAVKYLIKAKKLAPRNIGKVNPYEELYKVYRDVDKTDEALAALRERVAVDKKGYDVAVRLGKLALGKRKWKMAAWAAYQAIKVDPFKVEPHSIWGEAAENLKDFNVAEREWRLATSADAANADAKFGWARALLAQGRKPEAKWAAQEAKALDPERPDIKAFVDKLGAVEAKKPEEIRKPLSEEDKKLLRILTEDPAGTAGEVKRILEKPDPEKKKPASDKKEPELKKLEKVDACAPGSRRVAWAA